MPSVMQSANHSDQVSQVAPSRSMSSSVGTAKSSRPRVMKLAGVASASLPNRFFIASIGDVTAPPAMRARCRVEVRADRAGDLGGHDRARPRVGALEADHAVDLGCLTMGAADEAVVGDRVDEHLDRRSHSASGAAWVMAPGPRSTRAGAPP